MTRLKEPLSGTPTAASAEAEAASADSPFSNDPPRLSAMHKDTRDVIGQMLRKDAKTFDEAARAQTSGQ